jgi:hypothetical protein
MTFYSLLPPDEQELAAELMLELLYDYLPPGVNSAKVAQALAALNPYVGLGRAIAYSYADQDRALDWLQEKYG